MEAGLPKILGLFLVEPSHTHKKKRACVELATMDFKELVGLLYARLADDWLANAASQQRLLATLSMPTC